MARKPLTFDVIILFEFRFLVMEEYLDDVFALEVFLFLFVKKLVEFLELGLGVVRFWVRGDYRGSGLPAGRRGGPARVSRWVRTAYIRSTSSSSVYCSSRDLLPLSVESGQPCLPVIDI